MKIATWNIERLAHKRKLDEITQACENMQADILILTESDERVQPSYTNYFHTIVPTPLEIPNFDEPLRYAATEHRVSIYTNYKLISRHPTYDAQTALCVELETEFGNLVVYGTIMGILGNRRAEYRESIPKQLADIQRFVDEGKRVCICGDFNCSFADNYYFTNDGRNAVRNCFDDCGIELLTEHLSETIDHIALSNDIVVGKQIEVEEWNEDKSLSDHKGVSVRIELE